jgi:hypothetical protein
MQPRILQQKIHSTFSTNEEVWVSFRTEITNSYNSTTNRADFGNHVMREFNKKVRDLGLSSSLYFAPFDGGLRFIDVDISEDIPDLGYVFVYSNSNEQVFTNDNKPVQVLEEFSNS